MFKQHRVYTAARARHVSGNCSHSFVNYTADMADRVLYLNIECCVNI